MSPVWVSPSSSPLARPKSVIQTTPSVSSSRFDGLMSRCTIPRHGRRPGPRRPAGRSGPGCGRTCGGPTRPTRAGHPRAGSPSLTIGRRTMTGRVRADAPVVGPVASSAVALAVWVGRRGRPRCTSLGIEHGRGCHPLRTPAAGVEPTGENGPQHRADLGPFAECRALDAPAGVLWAGPERPASKAALVLVSDRARSRSRRSSCDDQVQALALDELHGIEADIAVLAHLEDRHDVGVVQPRRGAGLAAEPLLDHPVAGHRPRQDLQRHPAAQRDLLGLVDHAHAAPADLAEDPVVADQGRGRIRGPKTRGLVLALPGIIDLLHFDQRREEIRISWARSG